MAQWLEREFTNRKVRGVNPTADSRLTLPRLGQTGSILLLSGDMAVSAKRVWLPVFCPTNLSLTTHQDTILQKKWFKWLQCESTDRNDRGSNPTSASQIPLSRFGQPGKIPAIVLPSGGMAARHREGARAER
ncbi:hypothetical protein CSKR_103782 [Clonorchis sinensis]|uniref:Uncharacterized protein n=1 Tax=Clonorchis sinensis TaxID=79923 RepID=A0A419PY39_CLOSI|nr:hypothetical protein CSKR_103782 [Clonorchis sinensis]